MSNDVYHILSFDPPATTNLGWACFRVEGDQAILVGSGIEKISEDADDRSQTILGVYQYVLGLLARYPDVQAMCFERSIGAGFAPTREKLAENTGVIKLIGALRDIDFVDIHTGSMAKQLTGSAVKKGKKSRIKNLAKAMFFPDAKSFIEIAHFVNDAGKRVEFFEHQADAICFGLFHLHAQGIVISGPGGVFESVADGN